MLSIRDFSLRQKLVGLIVFISTTALLFTTFIFYEVSKRNLKQSMTVEAQMLAQVIGRNNTAAVLFGDKETVYESLQSLAVNSKVDAAYIYDSQKLFFVNYLRNTYREVSTPKPNFQERFEFTSSNLIVETVILENKEVNSYIYLLLNLSELNHQYKSFLTVILLVLVIMLLYSLMTALSLEKIITAPILNLAKFTREIREHQDFTVRIDAEQRKDEVGVLYKGVNQMLETIDNQRNILIQSYNEISDQKVELEAKSDQIEEQNRKLEFAYNQLSKINKDLTDSIVYAQYIQSSILPQPNQLQEVLGENFIFFKPKDIVSGDFYWVQQVNSFSFFAAADCTGHGVPGTLLSILGLSLLNQIVDEKRIFETNAILDGLEYGFIQTLNITEENPDRKNGLDISLCRLNRDTNELCFSGAMNPLYIIRNGEMILIKGDRFSVVSSIAFGVNKFTSHTIQLQKNDMLYIFSDGYQDQFGGPNSKKLKTRTFREILIEVSPLPVAEQKELLDYYFAQWKGDTFQVDDVLVIGVRI